MKKKSRKSEADNEIRAVLRGYLSHKVDDEPSLETQREEQKLRMQTLKNEAFAINMAERLLCRRLVCWFSGVWFVLVSGAIALKGLGVLDLSDSNIKYIAVISTGILGLFGYVVKYLFKV